MLHVTEGKLTEDSLKEIGYLNLLSLMSLGDLIYNCVVMGFFLFHLANRSYVFPLVAIIVIVVYDVFKLTKGIRELKSEMKKNEEAGLGKSVNLTTGFNEKGVITRDLVTDNQVNRKYEALNKIVITDNYFLLQASDKTSFPVFRNGLTKYQESEMIGFLKNKPTQIKWEKVVL